MPRQVGATGPDVGPLPLGLGMAVFTDVGDAESGQDLDIATRVRLGDDDQPYVGGLATGRLASTGDPLAYRRQSRRDFVLPAHRRHRTRAPNRPDRWPCRR